MKIALATIAVGALLAAVRPLEMVEMLAACAGCGAAAGFGGSWFRTTQRRGKFDLMLALRDAYLSALAGIGIAVFHVQAIHQTPDDPSLSYWPIFVSLAVGAGGPASIEAILRRTFPEFVDHERSKHDNDKDEGDQ